LRQQPVCERHALLLSTRLRGLALGRRAEYDDADADADGKIVQCWGDLFPVVRDALRS
jgi:hypothetical protein